MPCSSSLVVEVAALVALADSTAVGDSTLAVADSVVADMADWVATVVGIACSAADVALVVALVHVVDIEEIPILDLAGTSLAAAPIVEAISVVVLVDCPYSLSSRLQQITYKKHIGKYGARGIVER